MPKFDMESLTNLQNESSVVETINANFQKIEDALDEILFRKGTGAASDNAMIVDFDMNSKKILNLPEPSSSLEPVRKTDLGTYLTDAAASATAAETAKTAAETAQTAAETAQTGAETAETNAETAETNAQSILDEIETHSINSGVSTPVAVGTKSSGTYTPEPADGALLTGTNGGAFTLAAMTGTGWYRLTLVNSATAGVISTSGFDIIVDSSTVLEHTVENSVVELMGINDGVNKMLQVNLLLDATP